MYTNNTPDYFSLIAKVPRSFDRAHTFNAAASAELPFGRNKKWATSGFASAVLGGWQVNSLLTMYTGGPFSVTTSGGSDQADCRDLRNQRSVVRSHSLCAGDRGPLRHRRMGPASRSRPGQCGSEHLQVVRDHVAIQPAVPGGSVQCVEHAALRPAQIGHECDSAGIDHLRPEHGSRGD